MTAPNAVDYYLKIQQAFADGAPSIPHYEALKTRLEAHDEIPEALKFAEEWWLLRRKCYAHDARRNFNLARTRLANASQPLNLLTSIIEDAQIAEEQAADIDLDWVKNKMPEANGILALRFLRDFAQAHHCETELLINYAIFQQYARDSDDVFQAALKSPEIADLTARFKAAVLESVSRRAAESQPISSGLRPWRPH